jgi:hypothetical protein
VILCVQFKQNKKVKTKMSETNLQDLHVTTTPDGPSFNMVVGQDGTPVEQTPTTETTTTTVDEQPTTDTTVYEGPAEVSSRTVVRNEDGSITDSAFPETTVIAEEPAPIPPPDESAPAPAPTTTELVPTPVATNEVPVTPTGLQGEPIVMKTPNVNQQPELQTPDHLGGLALSATALVAATAAGTRRLFSKKR